MHSLLLTSLTLFSLASPAVIRQTMDAEENQCAVQQTHREIPDAGNHPGNVFLHGQTVQIAPPTDTADATRWQVTDENGRELMRRNISDRTAGAILLGKLPVGWYRIAWLDAAGKQLAWTTAAVLARLGAPTPQDSPICVDAAIAWQAKDDPIRQDQFSRLAALAGVNWIRDRMRWRDIQPAQGELISNTTYDRSADIQHRYGLNILQVFHDTPRWAAIDRRATGRFPTDLRYVYRFAQAISRRYMGRVQAWEPWNEANVATFGGHTIDEICSYQKAAFLGFKAGDPKVTVCWNATTAVPTDRHTDGVLLNETWSYFDTYNIHTYDWADAYQRLWKPARRAACGRPLWITESDRGLACEPTSATHDLSSTNQRLKAEYVTQSYVQSLQAGASRHFHFILGQYGEGTTQFGLLRHDMTPRAGYVALAALGRLLAGAQCLGRYIQSDSPALHVYALKAQPDGKERDILVIWTEKDVDWPARGKTSQRWTPPGGLTVEQVFDYLGRPLPITNEITLTSAPIFLVLPKGQCGTLPLTRPATVRRRDGTPCSVVLQCAMPLGSAVNIKRIPWASEFEYSISPNIQHDVPLFVYNFGHRAVSGTVRIKRLPEQCKVNVQQWQVQLKPMQRKKLTATFTISEKMNKEMNDAWITLCGDFGNECRPVLAFRMIASQTSASHEVFRVSLPIEDGASNNATSSTAVPANLSNTQRHDLTWKQMDHLDTRYRCHSFSDRHRCR